MHPARRVLPVLLLGLCLGAASASAAEHRTAVYRESVASQGMFARLEGFLTSVWSKVGCRIDPLGRCSPEQAVSQPAPPGEAPTEAVESDTGCAIDPWGGCARNR